MQSKRTMTEVIVLIFLFSSGSSWLGPSRSLAYFRLFWPVFYYNCAKIQLYLLYSPTIVYTIRKIGVRIGVSGVNPPISLSENRLYDMSLITGIHLL